MGGIKRGEKESVDERKRRERKIWFSRMRNIECRVKWKMEIEIDGEGRMKFWNVRRECRGCPS